MEKEEIVTAIESFLSSKKKPVSFGELAKHIPVDKKILRKVLRELIKQDKIITTKGHFSLNRESIKKVVGVVEANPAGFGFLIPKDGSKDIYIPFFEMQKVFDKDEVEGYVVLYKGKEELRIERVLKRARKELVCSISNFKKCIANPVDENHFHDIELSKNQCKNIKPEQLVLVKITKYPTKTQKAKGKIIEIIGNPSESFLSLELLKRKYNLKNQYPKEAIKELNSFLEKFDFQKEISRRKDLRDQPCFTIDPVRAKDFDDAVYLKKEGDDYRLFVHIADVSLFVKFGSALDKEAYERGTTVYLPGEAIHMLPEELSSNLCSLVPNEDRFCLSVEMVFDKSAKLKHYEIYESVINSKARLTYDQALDIITGKIKPPLPSIRETLIEMENLYRKRHKIRWDLGSIDFDLPEAEIVIDETGEPSAILPYERHIAHRIIEEFMVSANEVIATFMNEKSDLGFYRVHEKPNKDKVQNLLNILSGLGYKTTMPDDFEPKFFQRIIEHFEGKEEEFLVRFLTLRSMQKAKYSPIDIGHFGLASKHYTHFTSPIRRYPDIIVHRIIKSILKKKPLAFNMSYLEEAAVHLSEKERLADKIEYEAIDFLRARFMKDKIGEIFEGIITGIIQNGIFVQIKTILAEGFVSVSSMEGDFIYDQENHRFIDTKSHKTYRLGDSVKVKVIKVDEQKGKLDFEIVEEII
jgi:RNAse R (EC 3.1.-.-)